MEFFIYQGQQGGFELRDEDGIRTRFAKEADAIDAAVRVAQYMGRTYWINYWRP
jgi:hypothetical protein